METRDGVTRIFEVAPFGSEGAWRYDSSGVMIQVHCKDRGTA